MAAGADTLSRRVHAPTTAPADALDAIGGVNLLRELGLLADADIVRGLVVTDVSRRNQNYRVVTTDGPSFLIKQAGDADKARTLDNEARVYDALLRLGPVAVKLGLPAVIRYLPLRRALVLSIDPDTSSLATYHRRTRRFPPGIAHALGRCLAALHAVRDDEARALIPAAAGLPLVFSFDRPDVTVYYGASSATLQLFTAIHDTGDFADLLGLLRDEWRAECLVHADVRLDNCVVRPVIAARRGKELRLVDWEMAMWGDPSWDIATVLSEYLSLWLDHAPISEATPPEQFLDHGLFPLERWQPFVQQFWATYRSDGLWDRDLWPRAVRFMAARLVQTAYESTQFSSDLPGQVVLKLQLAQNILADPLSAGRSLFGIEQ